jgi:hypothetical protein
MKHPGKNARFDQSSPKQSDHFTLMIVKKIWGSTKTGRGWSGTLFFSIKFTINIGHLIKVKEEILP